MLSASVLPWTLCPVLEGPLGMVSGHTDCFPDLLVAEEGERASRVEEGESNWAAARLGQLDSVQLSWAWFPVH